MHISVETVWIQKWLKQAKSVLFIPKPGTNAKYSRHIQSELSCFTVVLFVVEHFEVIAMGEHTFTVCLLVNMYVDTLVQKQSVCTH